ncbi:hypothetical protein F5Y17DRAFT_457591 [Xylariaceae sp. FL0594]|nr:hypothetical protein F5Y17DRAFT_457591 [Xylariaceae sp. FL0594]
MVRRHAPQPLALAEDGTSNEVNGSRGPSSSSTGATTFTSTESTAPEARDRPSPHSLFAPDNKVQAIAPSSNSKSPRSPFSKFNPSRRPQTQQGEPRPQPVEACQPPPPPQPPAAEDTHLLRHQASFPIQNPQPTPGGPLLKQSATTPALAQAYAPSDEKHARSGSRFFNFGKGLRSNNQLHHSHTASSGEAMSRGADQLAMAERVPSKASKHSDRSSPDSLIQKPGPTLHTTRSDVSLLSTAEYDGAASRKNKPKPFTLLGRNKPLKEDDDESPPQSGTTQPTEPEIAATFDGPTALKTAPITTDAHERSFRQMMNSSTRNHSADRAFRDTSLNKEYRNDKENRSHPSSIKDSGGSTFFGGLKNSGSRAADMISKGLFGKGGRSTSASGREPTVDDEHYVLKVINLPLVEQTRKTRISKRLEDSRDKTEFWMPAFPWRAIDYLNFHGAEVEGLYRVPGSGPQIKKWQRRFDEEYDVDLLAQTDLYDINIIGSMLKAWLRELPDELFPKAAQERIARHCSGTDKVPQMLIDELSNLPPFNYYLLFAITCHLSMLLAHSEKNKMDFRNLCICFQPCMKIDAYCFKFLICDWKLCWKGCKNEAKYIEEEYQLFQQPVPRALAPDRRIMDGDDSNDDRAVSSDGSKTPLYEVQNGKLRKKTLATSQSNGNLTVDYSSSSTTLTASNDRELSGPRARDLRPLSPIKPLSPMDF